TLAGPLPALGAMPAVDEPWASDRSGHRAGLRGSRDASGRNVMTIITIITLFATLTVTGGQPADLCDLVYEDTGRPILCEPHPDGAPKYEDAVCGNDKSCKPANDGTCPSELDAYFCELGQLWADGYVSCYFEVPDYCDLFPCEPGFSPFPQANHMCCHEGIC